MPATPTSSFYNLSLPRARYPSRRTPSAPPVKFLIAIDFGTTLSSVAYVSSPDFNNENFVSKWDDVQDKKVPTVLKYDNGGTTGMFKWGHGAVKALRAGERLHEWFKLGLHREVQEGLAAESDLLRRYPSTTALPPVHGADCEKLVVNYLTSLGNAIDKYLMDELFLGEDVLIQKEYIMTIPAMWSEGAKQATEDCAREALNLTRDDEKQLQVIAEPEAAGIYALTKMLKIGLREGDTFIICDAGGGTIDLSSYRVKSLKPSIALMAVSVPSGGLCGSSFLNRIFEDYLRNRLRGHVKNWGSREMRWLKQAVDRWFDKDVKPHFRGEDDKFYIDTFALGEDIGIPGDELEISGTDIREKIFDPVITRIQDLVRDQIVLTIGQDEEVTAVLLAGGFGNNAYLKNQLEITCKEWSVKVHTIPESDIAIVRGALIYGRAKASKQRRAEVIAAGIDGGEEVQVKDEADPGIVMADVVSRLAPKHYGVIRYVPYDPDKHVGEYDVSKLRKTSTGTRLVEVMEWFVRKGDEFKDEESKKYRLRWEKEAKSGDKALPEITSSVFAYQGKTPPEYPHSHVHPNLAIATPLATLKIVFQELPIHERNGRRWYDEKFEVNMTLDSAKTSFFLVHNNKKHDIQEVRFSK